MRNGGIITLLLSALVLISCVSGREGAATPTIPARRPEQAGTPSPVSPTTLSTAAARTGTSEVVPASSTASAGGATPGSIVATPSPASTPLPAAALLANPVAVDFVSSNNGWLIAGGCIPGGVNGCGIFVTHDGGKTWDLQERSGVALSALDFQDAMTGWALGQDCQGPPGRQTCQGILLATVDGGAHWTVRRPGAILSQLGFADTRHGWALASRCSPDGAASCRSALRQTTDGGASWQALTSPIQTPRSLRMVDAADGWLAGCADAEDARTGACARPVVLATHDGGKSWQRQLALPATEGSFGAALAAFGTNDLWLLTGDTGACSMGGCWGPLYHTTDGGRHWAQEQPLYHWRMAGDVPGGPGFPGAPVFASPLVGWIPISVGAGPGVGGLATTLDGGQTWTRVGAQEGWTVSDVVAISPRDLWSVGARRASASKDQPFLFQSTDGGHTWRQRLPTSPLLPVAPPPVTTQRRRFLPARPTALPSN